MEVIVNKDYSNKDIKSLVWWERVEYELQKILKKFLTQFQEPELHVPTYE